MSTIVSIDAKFAQANIRRANNEVSASVSNLVSGQKKDANVADFSVGTVLESKVGVLRTTLLNAGQGKNLLNTAKGALSTILESLNTQKNLAVKSSDASLSDNERGFLNQQFQALSSEINRIADNAEFNGIKLVNGDLSGTAGLTTATDLAVDNFGVFDAAEITVAGSVASGDLSSTASAATKNVLRITGAGTSAGLTSVLTVRDGNGGAAGTISFATGSTIQETAANLVAAANSDTEAGVQNFRFSANGDGTITIAAKEAGTRYDEYDFNITTANGITATFGTDASAANDVVGTARALNIDFGTITGEPQGVAGSFFTREASDVGETATITRALFTATTAAAFTLTITDTLGVTEGVAAGETVTIAFTATTTEENAVDDLIDIINGGNGITASDGAIAGTAGTADGGANAADRLRLLRNFVFEKVDAANIDITGATKGTSLDGITFQVTHAGSDVSLGGAGGVDAGPVAFNSGTLIQQGTDRTVSESQKTVDTNLIGGLSEFSATFNGSLGDISSSGEAVTRNSATFSVEVNGKTYVSEDVYLVGGASATAGTIGSRGNAIAAGQQIIFYDPSGPVNSTGDLTDNAFVLNVGTSDISLADTTSASKAQESLNTIAAAFEVQFADATLAQERSVGLEQKAPTDGDHRITATIGTVLEGLKGADTVGTTSLNYNAGDIKFISDSFNAAGTSGSVGAFEVNRLTNQITTTVNGEKYTAYLDSSNLPVTGGVKAFGTNLNDTVNAGSYNATTKILDLNDETGADTTTDNVLESPKLLFFSESDSDGRILEIDLANVAEVTGQININSDEGEAALASALNAAFGVSDNESLTFQVGAQSSDSIGVKIGSAKTNDLYIDSAGISQDLSIGTAADAKIAGDVLTNAINNVVSLIADIDAASSAFNSAINNNEISIQNADAARSTLLDTDYSQESTRFAEARVKVDAAQAILSQVNARIQGLLALLRQ